MSFHADLEQFFESKNTDYDYNFKYDIEYGVRCRFLSHIQKTGKEPNNTEYNSFVCGIIEEELRRCSDLYGDLEQEWLLLKHYYKKEAERVKEINPYEPYRLWVLLDFILQLKKE